MQQNLSALAWERQNIQRIIVLAFVFLFFTVAIMINLSPLLSGQTNLMDFGSFYASGLNARDGINPYDPNSHYVFEIYFSKVSAGGKMVNLNPPISVVIFQYISQFEPYKSEQILRKISASIFIGLILLLTVSYRQHTSIVRFIWTFTLAGFWHTLHLGQIYIFPFLFATITWLLMRHQKYALAGIALGTLIAIKPNFAVWLIFFLAAGYYTTTIIAIIFFLAESAIPVLIYGIVIYQQWLATSKIQMETLIMPGNNSILGLTARFNNIPAGIILSFVVILILVLLMRKKTWENNDEKIEFISSLGIIASILASPISWTGYTILLIPIFISTPKWSHLMIASAIILSIPFGFVLLFFQTSFINFIIFGWFYGWANLAIMLDLVLQTKRLKRY